MKEDAFAMLTAADWALLARHMRTQSYARGQRLLQEGTRERALLLVRSGSVRVERLLQGRPIVLRELGPGEVLGEIGFIENAPASASVVAQETCTADVIDGDVLQSLIATEPGFAVRFYHSLAVALARRTRAGDAARMAAAAAEATSTRLARTGNLSPRQVPPELEAGLEAFDSEMLAVRSSLRRGAPANEQAARVAAACDAVVSLMDVHTQGDAVVDIGWSDLLAFRDAEAIEAGIGDCVFRETFSTFMLSACMSRCHAKPRGFADDHETMKMIHRCEPEGDDWTGALIDRWFLHRPLARSRRAGAQRVQLLVRDMAAAHGPGLQVASLAAGCAQELFAFFEQHRDARVQALCVDADEQALLAAARRAEALQLGERMSFLLGQVLPADGEALPLQRQHLVYALGLAEYLDDDELLALLERCHAMLLPGGRLMLSNLAAGQPDRRLMTHLLDWRVQHRSPDELQALWNRSPFAGRPLAISTDEASVYVEGVRD